MILSNKDIKELIVEIPGGHEHLRTTILLKDGSEFIFQESTIANLVRAFIAVKTHPSITRVRLKGRRLSERKEGYADWQLLEVSQGEE